VPDRDPDSPRRRPHRPTRPHRSRAAEDPRALHYARRRAWALFLGFALFVTIVAGVDAATDDTFRTRTTGPTLAQAGINAALPTLKAREDARNRQIVMRKRENVAIKDVLGYTSYVTTGTPNAKEVALTFDDGPSEYTSEIIKILDREKAPATFFQVGSAVRTYPDVTRELIAKGYAVANHTETHPRMGDLDAATQAREIDRTSQAVEAFGIPRPKLWRPPFGSFNATTLALLKQRDMLMVIWDVDTNDYAQPGTISITQRVLQDAKPGSIVLMHDGGGVRSQTVEALPEIIKGLRAKGFTLVSVPQLLLDDPPPRDQPLPRRLDGA
jgi:peptidoglycan/xylan/chitin deacetylase (PgdA/CDA1 family)